MTFLMRTAVIAVAVAVAAWLVPGISVGGATRETQAVTLIAVAVIIGLVNALVRPAVTMVTGCLVVLTLGVFLVVINAWMLMLSGWLARQLGLSFAVDGFWSALVGSLIVSAVTWVLSGMLRPSR